MRVANRFRGSHSTDLPGAYPTVGRGGGGAGAGGKALRRQKHRGYRLLFGVVAFLFLVALVTYVRHGSNGGGVTPEAPHTNSSVAPEASKPSSPPPPPHLSKQSRPHASSRSGSDKTSEGWSTSPPTLPTLSEEVKRSVMESISKEAQTATSTTTTTTTAAPTTATPTTANPKPQPLTEGERSPAHPEQLPNLRLHTRTYTSQELHQLYDNFTIVYTFVNGSEANHYYRKRMLRDCGADITRRESEWFLDPAKYYNSTPVLPNGAEEDEGQEAAANGAAVADPATARNAEAVAWAAQACLPSFIKKSPFKTMGDVWRATQQESTGGADNRDRETDELRHSLRSVEQHMSWHRGRVILVSPGHHPTWMDNAKTFLSNKCGGEGVMAKASAGAYLRVITVHQDALMPYGIKLTTNSHVIEQHLWRVKDMGPVHVYYNDDYFVNRDVFITDLFNEHGGTIIRTEAGVVAGGELADLSASWAKGVKHTILFDILELEELPENYLPKSLRDMWRDVRHVGPDATTVPVPDLAEVIDTAFYHNAEPMPNVTRRNTHHYRYATHAPFVYCTNMFSYIETRYEREFAYNTLHHRGRKARDLFIPFVYNAFAMRRPWQASPKFLPYLLTLNEGEGPATADIELNNFDGCAPVSTRSGWPHSGCVFAKFSDDAKYNSDTIERIRSLNPLYFNINSGFSKPEAIDQLRNFLHDKFPTPIYLERGLEPVSDADRALPDVYAGLMGLPVIAVTSFAEGVCPMVRSLQLALPDHSGIVISAVARHGTDGDGAAADKTLSALRAEMLHRVRNGMPVTTCAYNERVRPLRAAAPVPASREAALSDDTLLRIVRTALEEAGSAASAAVALPDVCGYEGASRIRAIVLDGRTDVRDAMSLRHAVTMPGQSLALEDFEVVPVGDGSGDAVLVLSRQAADAKSVHWIDGAAESDLLLTYPIPYEPYENLDAPLAWSE